MPAIEHLERDPYHSKCKMIILIYPYQYHEQCVRRITILLQIKYFLLVLLMYTRSNMVLTFTITKQHMTTYSPIDVKLLQFSFVYYVFYLFYCIVFVCTAKVCRCVFFIKLNIIFTNT